jgi:hypothetical protein
MLLHKTEQNLNKKILWLVPIYFYYQAVFFMFIADKKWFF